MAQKKNKKPFLISHGLIADNKKARFDYEILETIDAGIQLFGSEVKALRAGKCQIKESYAGEKNGRIFLFNLHIGEWSNSPKYYAHEALRPRPLLLRKKEHLKYLGKVQKSGLSLIPLRLFFNEKGLAKCVLALGQGKKIHDKRETIKQRDWQREQQRLFKKIFDDSCVIRKPLLPNQLVTNKVLFKLLGLVALMFKILSVILFLLSSLKHVMLTM